MQPSSTPADPMASNAVTWKGFELSPLTPRTRECIANVFRTSAHDALTETERAMCLALAEKWGTP